MRQTCESERENGGNNDAERERTSESEIEDLGAQLDKACASRPLDRAQHGMTRHTAAYCATPAKTDSKSLVLRVVEREMKLFEHVQFQFNREKLAKLRICSSWGGIHMRWQ